jgi:hypothetical protein
MSDIMMAMTEQYDNERYGEEFVSITPSGFFGENKDNVVQIDNFLNEYELSYLNDFVRQITEWDVTNTHYNEDGTIIYEADYWKDRVLTSTNLYNQNRKAHRIIEYATERLKERVQDKWNLTVVATQPSIVRWLPGQLQMPHADKELHEGDEAGKPNDFPYYDIGSLFYLNDDYEGGELYFPKQGLEFKPKAGSAYFFPGDLHYIHGVKEIKSGVRYTCPRFWIIKAHSKPETEKENA